ncbi:MAG: DUF3108 domain-containing protein [Opitutaceae bacterium]
MSFLRRFFIPLLLLPSFAWSAEPALKPGEGLSYRVSWGIFTHAGDIKINASSPPTSEKSPRLQVVTTTATRGVAKALYVFEARAESLYDPATGRLLLTSEASKAGDRETKISTSFDYLKHTATYSNAKNPDPVVLTMPAGEPQDLIMSLVQTRRWNLKPGERQDALVIFGDDFYELTIYAERYEEVKTPLGTFKTLLLVPRMEKTPPKGMFKRGGAVRVWISQDDRRLPVKFQVDFKFGAGVATLSAYQPPEGASAPAKAPPASSSSSSAAPSDKDAKNSRP